MRPRSSSSPPRTLDGGAHRYRAGDALRSLLELGAKEATLLRIAPTRRAAAHRDAYTLSSSSDRRPFSSAPGTRSQPTASSSPGILPSTLLLTGESLPVDVGPGDEATGATNTWGAPRGARATHVGADTALARISRTVAGGSRPARRLSNASPIGSPPCSCRRSSRRGLSLAGWLIAGILASSGLHGGRVEGLSRRLPLRLGPQPRRPCSSARAAPPGSASSSTSGRDPRTDPFDRHDGPGQDGDGHHRPHVPPQHHPDPARKHRPEPREHHPCAAEISGTGTAPAPRPSKTSSRARCRSRIRFRAPRGARHRPGRGRAFHHPPRLLLHQPQGLGVPPSSITLRRAPGSPRRQTLLAESGGAGIARRTAHRNRPGVKAKAPPRSSPRH